MSFDLTFARSQFPALADGFAYFDNAGGSLVLKTVADRIHEYLMTTSVQTGANYAHSQRASARLAEARARIALLMGARRPAEIVFGPSTTALLQYLARAMAYQFKPGDEVIVTRFDHESNIGAWLSLEALGVVIKFWDLDKDSFEIDLEALERLLSPRTRLVAVTHVSNILGTIHPIAEIARLVHAHGAKIVVDGVAYAPHRAIDVAALDVDYYVFSFYKAYGPHFAALYGRYDDLLALDSLYHYFYGRDKVPGKLEPGNPCYELAWGAAGIVDYFDALGGRTGDRAAIERAFAGIASHEAALGERLLTYLRGRNDIQLVGRRDSDPQNRVPTISFKAISRDSAEIVTEIDKWSIGIRNGDFHSRRLVESLDLAADRGVVRVSMVHYNTIEEVDRLIGRLDRALA
ncbi:MAG: cysteine desulfurase-like protein [Pseudomonadota bacterium]